MSNIEPIEASSKQKPQKRNYSDRSISIMIEPGIQGQQSKRTDIEVLCEIIYAHGERYICEISLAPSLFSKTDYLRCRYDDGTAAIGFTWLFKVSH